VSTLCATPHGGRSGHKGMQCTRRSSLIFVANAILRLRDSDFEYDSSVASRDVMSTLAAFVTAHTAVIGLWAGAFLLLTGSGSLLYAASGRRLDSWRDISTAFWVGLAVATLVLQLWHFVAPVNGAALLVLAVLSAAGWISGASRPVQLVHRRPPLSRGAIAVIVVVAIWVANRALGPTGLYDTGMYHQQVLNWSTAHPLVPGLGNLHGRLAFNSSALLLGSLFDVGLLHQMAIHTFNSLLVVMLVIEGLVSLTVLRSGDVRAFHLFSVAILPTVIHGVVRQDVRSLSTDATVAAVLFAATRLLFDAFAHRSPDRRTRAFSASMIITLFATAACMKLSAAVFGVLASLVALTLLRREGSDAALRSALVAVLLAPAFLLAMTWMARGVVLSGHPFYPSAILAFSVDWRVPAEQAAAESAWITMSARNLNSNVTYAGYSWIVPYVRGVMVRGDLFVQFTLPILIVGTIGAVGLGRRAIRPALWRPGWNIIWIPFLGAALFWMVTAPHPRLGSAFAWGAAAIVAAWSSAKLSDSLGRPRRTMLGTAAPLLAGLLLVKQAVGAAWRDRSASPWTVAAEALLTLPHNGEWMAVLPDASVARYHTKSGLQLVVPTDDNRCFDAPLPCTPHPTPYLAARGSSRADGFRTDGSDWAPERWPNPFTSFLTFWRCSREGPGTRAAREARCLATTRGDAGT
jgi:hypothetical protein